ncbi:hypothetical protein MLD55_05130 [Alcanivorax sp. MM125-6]|nr:hypothetical protein [Alcanivorax sp. MM125-6]
MIYIFFAVAAIALSALWAKAVSRGKKFMRCALYLHYMQYADTYKEVLGDDADTQAESLYFAMRDFNTMSDSKEKQNFCFEVLQAQSRKYGGKKNMEQAAIMEGYPS